MSSQLSVILISTTWLLWIFAQNSAVSGNDDDDDDGDGDGDGASAADDDDEDDDDHHHYILSNDILAWRQNTGVIDITMSHCSRKV